MANTLQHQVREFFSASTNSFSYNLKRNSYIWFGILWGVPIPLTTILFEALLTGTHGFQAILNLALTTPIQWFFFMHPVIFGALFGILGTIQNRKDIEKEVLIEELRHLSSIDTLTGLNNRRSFTKAFTSEVTRVERNKEPLSLLLIDLDHFKQINDVHGHKVGDEVLTATGRYLRSHARPYDVLARWGGEEFIMLLAKTNEDEADRIAERIREGMQDGLDQASPVSVSASIGVSQYQVGDSLEGLAERADKALYHAKKTGRNKCVRWSLLAS